MSKQYLLKNLQSMIRNVVNRKDIEFEWQDIRLTNEFENLYAMALEKNGCHVIFFDATAVITSTSQKNIYVPNQWFVIASFAVDLYEELNRYKKYYLDVCEKLSKNIESYTKLLRDEASDADKVEFEKAAQIVFGTMTNEEEVIEETAARLWRFAYDYSWWSGQKTIDRGDFYLSVILNTLNLLNASQGYVGDIVSTYASNSQLKEIVKTIDGFTEGYNYKSDYEKMYINICDEKVASEKKTGSLQNNKTNMGNAIKIRSTSAMKEIKFK